MESRRRDCLISHSKVVLFIVVLLLLVSTVFGQADQGRIGGTVKDSTGAVILGVSIRIKNDRTGEERTAITGDVGEFLVPALKPSAYTVKAELAGFTPTEVSGIQVVVGQKVNLDLTIKPASVNETVTVETAAEAALDTS